MIFVTSTAHPLDCSERLTFCLGRLQETTPVHPCQDCFGENSKPLGGYAGLAEALGFATEHQGDGTPHGHGFVSLVNAYQHGTLLCLRFSINLSKKVKSPRRRPMSN